MFKARLAALHCCSLVGLLMGGCRDDLSLGLDRAQALMMRHHYVAAEAALAPAVGRWRAGRGAAEGGARTAPQLRAAATAYRRLAELYELYLDMPERALEALDSLAALAPAAEADAARWRAAQLMVAGGADPQAQRRALAELAAAQDSRFRQQAGLALVGLLLAEGDIAAAQGMGEALLARAEDGAGDIAAAGRALAQVAEAHLGVGRPEAAVALYGTLAERLPEGPLEAQVRFGLGCARQHLGADDPALVAFLAALPHHPSPKLVAEKIERVRQRLVHTHPTGKILSASGRQTFADAASRRPRAARPRG